jgi:hypothetical protein
MKKKMSRYRRSKENKGGINLFVQSGMRTHSPRRKRHRRGFHEVTRRHSIPLRREQNLEGVLSSREINRQHGNARVRLICRVRRQGGVVSVANRLCCPESSATWRVENLDLQLLRSNSQICDGPFRIDSRVRVHPPLDGGRSLDLVLE